MVLSMNVLELVRRKQIREERVKAAQIVSLCYRGVVYERKTTAK